MKNPLDFLPLLQILTAVLYYWFAWQCWQEYRKLRHKTPAAKGFLALIVVFGLCALSGYLLPFIEVELGFDGLGVKWFHVAIHALLPCAALALVLTNSARMIMQALDDGRD